MKKQLNHKQENALNLILQGSDVILLGPSGTGKSTVINEAIEQLKNKGLRVVKCAPTGTAARIVQGRTVHNAFDYPLGVMPKNYRRKIISAEIYHSDVIIVDELSMIRVDVMECLIKDAKLKKKPAQLILCGDYRQLQPVISDGDRDAFEKQWGSQSRFGYAFDSILYKQLKAKIVNLTEPMRQREDTQFFYDLSLVGNGNYEGALAIMDRCSKEEFGDDIYIFPRKEQVDKKNLEKINEIPKKQYTYRATVLDSSFYREVQQPPILNFKEGCRVMSLMNEPNGAYFNGSLGTVVSCEDDFVVVKFDENSCVHEIHQHEYKKPVYDSAGKVAGEIIMGYHLPLTLSYATTHHKCQGQTYCRANIDPQCFACGELYTVLSRVKNVGNMYLISEIKKRDIIVSLEVRNYYQQLKIS